MPPAQHLLGRGLGGPKGGGRGVQRRPNALARYQLKSFRFSSKRSIGSDDNGGGTTSGNNSTNDTLPEEGSSSLHHHFQTCPSLSRVREEFRATIENESEHKKLVFGINCCARLDSTGRLLVHSIGLNVHLIACGGGFGISIEVTEALLMNLYLDF